MTALIQTIETPDGAFTILADERQRVLSSGWTSDVEAILTRLSPANRPEELREAETEAADAALAFYAGDLSAIDAVTVKQSGTVLQLAGWSALRAIEPGAPLTYTGFAARLGNPNAVRAAASICARKRPGAVRAVPPRAAHRRQPRRLRLGAGREGEPARAREHRRLNALSSLRCPPPAARRRRAGRRANHGLPRKTPNKSGMRLVFSWFTAIGWWAVAPTGRHSRALRRTP